MFGKVGACVTDFHELRVWATRHGSDPNADMGRDFEDLLPFRYQQPGEVLSPSSLVSIERDSEDGWYGLGMMEAPSPL